MFLRRICLSSLLTACLLIFFLAPVTFHRRALALSTDPITITSQTNSVHFPNSITFNVNASDRTSTIVSATFVVNIHSFEGTEAHKIPITTPLHIVSLRWQEDTSGSKFIPPGTMVYYHWEFADKAGGTYVEPQQALTTVDTRFPWQHLTSGLLQVNWYNRSQDFGQAILSQASMSIDNISKTLGGGLLHPINLWVYETDLDFHGSLAPGSYEWVGGVAFPTLEEASIVVTGMNDHTLIRDMPHELTHLIFHQLIQYGAAGNNYPPTWFDEGLAVYNQAFHEPDMKNRFDQALATHSLLRLSEISDGFPSDANQAYLAYAQSWNLLTYMYNTFHQGRMAQLIRQMNDPELDFDTDLVKALGIDEIHLENQWRLSLQQPGVPLPTSITPTPQVVFHRSQTANSSDDRSWVLIALGGVLVLVSLVGFVLLFASITRRKQPVAQKTPVGQQHGQNGQSSQENPSIYVQPWMSAQPTGEPAPFQGQEYSSLPPRRQVPQE